MNNLQAFPGTFINRDNYIEEPYLGMTLWDYAFIHAPGGIPEWFEHQKDPMPKHPENEEDILKGDEMIPENVFQRLANWRMDPCYDINDLTGQKTTDQELKTHKKLLKNFAQQWEDHWTAICKWHSQDKENRYFQWRKYFADNVLKRKNEIDQ